MGESTLVRLLALAVALGCGLSAAAATVTLQQGVDGYKGCTTATHWGKATGKTPDPSRLCLRGAHNRLLVRFELPEALADRPLARARLCLFLPAARKPNTFTEIFCHEVTIAAPAVALDQTTDYGNGRRPGAVDSVELFAPPHQYWNHFPWLPLGVPEGGRWIELNVTPLVEKWLESPESNHGVALLPTSCPDRRFPSTWEIDIPSARSKGKPELRPKLVLELAEPGRECLVGMTNGLRRICDRSTRYAYRGSYGARHRLCMAANELEGFQVVVYPMLADLGNARFTATDLTTHDGKAIPAADVEYFIEDWYTLRANWKTRDVFFRGKLYDTVDPLVPAKPITLRRHVHTPFYFRVRTRPDTPPGLYRGTITLLADDAKPIPLALEVKVWPYAIPQRWNFHTMGQFVRGNVRRFHGSDLDDRLARAYHDFLLDHRFAPTEQYIPILSPRADLEHCLARGMNTIYLSGNFRGTDGEMAALEAARQTVAKLGALDFALVYVGDETNKWDEMHRRADLVHARLPGVQVMIGGSFPREELLGYIDVYDPQIGGKSKVYSLHEQNAHLIGQAQRRGEEFYWYVAAGPAYPYPNVQVEYPLIASRVLFWMTWKYGVTGFEYYCYNIWERNYAKEAAKRYPNARWQADGWSRGWPTNGDGMLFYPGPISSLRFEAIRDGIEDWESHLVLRDCVEALARRKNASKHRALLAKAEKLLEIDGEVVADFKSYTTDPDVLLARREALGDLIARLVPLVADTPKWDAGAYTLAKAAEVRIARQTALRRTMLRGRHQKACQALKIPPLPRAQWDAQWPRRVLFEQRFEAKGDWDGQLVASGRPDGKSALAAHAKNRHFAQFLRVGIRHDHARAATTTWLRFAYRLSKAVPLEIMLFDLTQGDNYAARIPRPVVGTWAEATLKVTGVFRRKDGSNATLAAGDAIDDVFFGAGRPGDDVRLLVDDVVLLGLD